MFSEIRWNEMASQEESIDESASSSSNPGPSCSDQSGPSSSGTKQKPSKSKRTPTEPEENESSSSDEGVMDPYVAGYLDSICKAQLPGEPGESVWAEPTHVQPDQMLSYCDVS